jgi:hypothetical protein
VIERNAKSVNAGRLAETNPKKRHDCGLSLIQWQGRSWAPTHAADVYWIAICTVGPAIQAALT